MNWPVDAVLTTHAHYVRINTPDEENNLHPLDQYTISCSNPPGQKPANC